MKIHYVPIDSRWLERIRREAEALRQVQNDPAFSSLEVEKAGELQKILGTCAGELETIRWSALNHDVVVKEGKPLWHEKEDDGE